ncbi:Alanine racemase [Stanieria cyanosphaera PCC 7437]|uniref:Alanine racemase n=1 Tax=Stanieria cyanosphaera (strain ATCC 29371 / PCC 7437) TaxID=111780 RepID=K9XYR5_STAC7|nr:alanine racemase [Stanieria cyanosphaera]AFZ37745.1 Alanine racemase [Stanieria cyanosphaera PCC 7437]
MLSWQPTTGIEQLSLVNRQRAWVEIDLKALAHNVRQIKQIISPATELMAVVKADAYGHGAVTVAQTALAHGASVLAIATLAEGIELRQAGINAPILILGAINTAEEIKAVAAWQLEPTICNPQQALIFAETLARSQKNLAVHLKLDTGMSRLGTNWQSATEFVRLVQQLPYLSIASIYSHLATADELDPTIMKLQQQRFQSAISQLKLNHLTPPCLHLANSAATLSDRSLDYDLVRVGLALYGLYPASHLQSTVALKPVLQLKAKITQVKQIAAGTGVSYGHHFVADQDLTIAVVGIGYADGVPRHLSNRLKAIVRGQLVRQIGTITMDQLMLDVSDLPNLQPGEIVTLIGKDGDFVISADDWANTLNTISWEILCGFKHRLPRVNI